VALGRALGMTLLAEGVETEEQRVLLRLAGCEEMQGYLFARPGPREALDRLLAATSSPAVPRPLLRSVSV
jgi:EAL domain-containing protein (putative c-di-GMP-specific phosphodiesterase class I)